MCNNRCLISADLTNDEKSWWKMYSCSFLVLHFAVFRNCTFILKNNIVTFIALNVHFFSTGLSGSWWEPWINCPSWERPSMVGRLPDTVWTCCGGLLMLVFRLTLMIRWLQSATLQMEHLAFIGSLIGITFFLKLIYHTMRWATWTPLIPCLIMWLSITLDIQTTATKIASLFLITQGREDLWMFMWHSTQIRNTLTRITPTALALIFWRTFKSWAVKTSSADARIVLNIYP